jgi:hypothetical protein
MRTYQVTSLYYARIPFSAEGTTDRREVQAEAPGLALQKAEREIRAEYPAGTKIWVSVQYC